jgi:hypothetical protein
MSIFKAEPHCFVASADSQGQNFIAVLGRELSKISEFFQSQEAALEVTTALFLTYLLPSWHPVYYCLAPQAAIGHSQKRSSSAA